MSDKSGFAGWRMVAIAFLAQGCAMGVAGGAYGTALVSLENELGITRALASSALSVMLLSLGICSPFVGNLLNRISIRTAMMVGAVLCAAGNAIIAYAPSFAYILAAFALLIGPGACLLGPVSVSLLVSRWFERDLGKALTLANAPLFLLITPPLAAIVLTFGGRQLLYSVIAGIFVFLFFLLGLVVDRPEDVGQMMRREDETANSVAVEARASMSTGSLLTSGTFWLLSLGVGVFSGVSSAFITHSVALARSKGTDLESASIMLSSYGVGMVIGSLVFGWLNDKIGPVRTLLLTSAIQAAIWFILIATTQIWLLLVLACLIGCCIGAVVGLHGAGINEFFGKPSFGRAMGLSYFLKIPFLFAIAPLSGHLFDSSGNYRSTLVMYGVLTLFAAVMFISLRSGKR